MKKKEVLTDLLVIILGLASIYAFAILDMQLKESAQELEVSKYSIYRVLQVLTLVIFGLLIEYKRIIFIFKNSININKYSLITAICICILLVLPYEFTIKLGIGSTNSIQGVLSLMLNDISIRSIVSLFTGVLIVRSLSKFRQEE